MTARDEILAKVKKALGRRDAAHDQELPVPFAPEGQGGAASYLTLVTSNSFVVLPGR